MKIIKKKYLKEKIFGTKKIKIIYKNTVKKDMKRIKIVYLKNKKNIIKNGQKIILKKYLINQTKDVIKKKIKVME